MLCVIYASVIHGHLKIDLIMFVLKSDCGFAWEMSALTCTFPMHIFRLRIDPSCCVDVVGIDGQ